MIGGLSVTRLDSMSRLSPTTRKLLLRGSDTELEDALMSLCALIQKVK